MIGETTSDLYITIIIVAIASLPIAGFVYDILGRRFVIISCLFSSCALLVLVPHTSPNMLHLKIVRSFLGMIEAFATTNPLIADYVKSDSRGKGVSIEVIGALIG